MNGLSFADRPIVMVGLLAALSLMPFLLVMMTSFVKIAVVLSILRNAIGSPQVPPTMVVTGLAFVLSLFVMAPVGADIYRAVQPAIDQGQGSSLTSAQAVTPCPTATARKCCSLNPLSPSPTGWSWRAGMQPRKTLSRTSAAFHTSRSLMRTGDISAIRCWKRIGSTPST